MSKATVSTTDYLLDHPVASLLDAHPMTLHYALP